MISRLRDAILDCGGVGLRLRGGGSKDFYGQSLGGEILDTRGHSGIVAYEPAELVVTARAGTPLAELEATLAEKGQLLAFEPPHFAGGDATVGGCVATGLSGPRRATAGAVRDHVLGVQILDGSGQILNFGGQVMKNVAGFDVSRLLVGSLGTLGLILQVSFKVLPRPVAEATLRFELPQEQALHLMNQWAGRPLPVSATCWQEGLLTLRLSGAGAAVAAARQTLGGEVLAAESAQTFWRKLRDQRLEFFAGDGALWRLAVPSTAPPLELPGETLIEWGGGQRWWRPGGDGATTRELAARAGGHATLFRGGDKGVGVFQPLPPPLLALHRRVK
ncbi:MAG TPA: glycolate oxidase subunit GlcE, partial [Rhodocyclaceae bacterium]|nr:glycolate oxidase subunit GlcE [Rhodocyclaceae bacterium]